MEEMKYPETQLSEEDRKKVESLKMEIHLEDSQAALQYGVGAQKNISEFADTILSHVRAKGQRLCRRLMTGSGDPRKKAWMWKSCRKKKDFWIKSRF